MPFLFKLARRVARIRARACILAVAAAIACDAPDHLVSPSDPTFITSSAATTCQASAVSWWTGALSSAQTGTFTATFDVTPNGSALDAVTGLATGSVTGYTGMAMIVRFNSANTIERDVPDRGEVKKIDIPLNRLLQFCLWLSKDQPPHRFGRCNLPAVGPLRAISESSLAGVDGCFGSVHCRSN